MNFSRSVYIHACTVIQSQMSSAFLVFYWPTCKQVHCIKCKLEQISFCISDVSELGGFLIVFYIQGLNTTIKCIRTFNSSLSARTYQNVFFLEPKPESLFPSLLIQSEFLMPCKSVECSCKTGSCYENDIVNKQKTNTSEYHESSAVWQGFLY